MLIKVMGSSLVKGLFKAMSSGENPAMEPHFGLRPHHSVDFSWISGGTAEHFDCDVELEKVFRQHYDLVIIVAGGNDLSYAPAEKVAAKYMELIEKLLQQHCVYVVFSQVMPRESPRHLTQEAYCAQATILNGMMGQYMDGVPRMKLWKNKGLWNACEILMLWESNREVKWPISIFADGVHLNTVGLQRLYYSLHHAA